MAEMSKQLRSSNCRSTKSSNIDRTLQVFNICHVGCSNFPVLFSRNKKNHHQLRLIPRQYPLAMYHHKHFQRPESFKTYLWKQNYLWTDIVNSTYKNSLYLWMGIYIKIKSVVFKQNKHLED